MLPLFYGVKNMEVFVPDYYRRFSCLAGACPDSCCKEWEVDVDEGSAEKYRALDGPLGDRLRQVLRPYDGGICMTIENGRCPMWRQDGLCEIQAQLGHGALCRICREYPRLRQDYGDFAELSMELSCPEAARLIFGGTHGHWEQTPETGDADYDRQAMDTLRRSRQTLFRFWQETALSMPEALTVTLLYGHSVQAELDGGEEAVLDVDACLADGRRYAGDGDMTLLADFFGGLELLTARWAALLQAVRKPRWEERLRPLMGYFLRRYWLQAVWDYDLVCRVKLMVAACVLISAMPEDILPAAQLFSKEIENDADNLDTIFDGAYTAPALTDSNLLGLLQ